MITFLSCDSALNFGGMTSANQRSDLYTRTSKTRPCVHQHTGGRKMLADVATRSLNKHEQVAADQQVGSAQ